MGAAAWRAMLRLRSDVVALQVMRCPLRSTLHAPWQSSGLGAAVQNQCSTAAAALGYPYYRRRCPCDDAGNAGDSAGANSCSIYTDRFAALHASSDLTHCSALSRLTYNQQLGYCTEAYSRRAVLPSTVLPECRDDTASRQACRTMHGR